MVYRVYVEKKAGQTHEADGLLREIQDFLQIENLSAVRVLNRYDAENIEEVLFNPNIRLFSNESILHIRWPKYWSFSLNISPSNEHQD